ncbi:MAG TPA: CHASE3 domain-containing protein [Streptosporangiaceae bacterium]|jgi:signal transduction histidine kinase/CHASE3 domain sensor protein
MGRFRRSGGRLIRRTVAVSVLLSAVIGAAFSLLMLAIDDLRDSEERAKHALEVLVAANRLERLVIDIESTQRGFIITGEPRFLDPWYDARRSFAQQATTLERRAAAGDTGQGRRARQITQAADSYISDYAVPLVAKARQDPGSARTVAVTADGKRRVDALRQSFIRFMAHERQIFEAGQDRADAAAHLAIIAASIGVAGTIALILLSGGYLARSVVRPVRRASSMAGQVAGGDLTARMPETGPGEVGMLERALNTMARSLQTSHNDLRRIVDEQAALRRVATLVARGVPPAEVFGAVAAEAGHVLGAECTAIARFEPDRRATIAGSWAKPGDPGLAPALGSRWPADEASVAGQVQRTGRPARVPDYEAAGGEVSAWAREHGIRSGTGSPIVVEGRLWGVIIAFSGAAGLHPEGTEERLLAFTELAGMAVANTESRAELAASRARVVAAADETRRRIERDLHDGTQQRLVSLALELRAAEARVPPEQRSLVQQWSRTAQGLTDVVEELREISRGLHPAVLEKGGLGPALRALARRAGVPVDLSVRVSGRLPERVEVAAYYVVSEALTNAAKHARASAVSVDVDAADDTLRLLVRDDGVGGADPSRGSGLIGLSDRVAAVGGRIEITSPSGGGTSLLVTIPVGQA